MKKRIITGIVYLGILLPLVIINCNFTHVLYTILTMFVCFYGSYEIMRAANNSNMQKNDGCNLGILKYIIPSFSSILGFLSIASTYNNGAKLFITAGNVFEYLLYIYILFVFVILCFLVCKKNSSMKDYGSCLAALTYSGLLMGLAFSIRFLEPHALASKLNITGTKCFLFVYAIVILTDSFAMIFGCKFGKHRLAPVVSPKKSVEGAIFGLIGGALAGILGLFAFGICNYNTENLFVIILLTIVVSLLISCAGQFGDLIESKIKRCYEIKDMGNILPGHGGILDRFDSLLFAGLIFYIAITFIAKLI